GDKTVILHQVRHAWLGGELVELEFFVIRNESTSDHQPEAYRETPLSQALAGESNTGNRIKQTFLTSTMRQVQNSDYLRTAAGVLEVLLSKICAGQKLPAGRKTRFAPRQHLVREPGTGIGYAIANDFYLAGKEFLGIGPVIPGKHYAQVH